MIESNGKNLIFLVSAPRAGSTLLGAMLGSLPKVACPPEVWVQLLLTLFRQDGIHADTPFDHDLALRAFLETAGASSSRDACRSFALTIYNNILAADENREILVDKTPRYYHILEQLGVLWPEAKYIWVQRNPLDIVASCKDTWSIDVAEQMGEVVTPHSYDTTVSFDRLLHFFSKKGRGHIVRYEDLTENPELALKKLCRKLGLTYSPAMLVYGENQRLVSEYQVSSFGDKKVLSHTSPHRQSVGRWRTVLDQNEVKKVITTLGTQCFIDQGYESELKEARDFANVRKSDLKKVGSWRKNLQAGESAHSSTGNESLQFTATRMVRKQNEELLALRIQYDKRVQEVLTLCTSADTLKNERNLLQAQLADLQANFTAVEQDRLDRGKLIETQGKKLSKIEAEYDSRLTELKALYASADTLKNERNLLQAQLADLQANFTAVEQDRLDRGKLIEAQGKKLTKIEAEYDSRLTELKALYASADTLKNERNLLQAQLADLQANFTAVEQDRLDRGKLIEAQGTKLSKIEAEYDSRLTELKALYASADTLKNERNLLQAQLADLQANFTAVEQDRLDRGKLIETQGKKLSKIEAEYDSRLTELKALYASADTLKNERNLLQAQLADLQANFTAVEQDRLDRGKLIEAQGTKLSKIEAEYDSRLTELKALYASADTLKNERNLLQAQLADLQANFTAVEQDRLDRGKLIEAQGTKLSKIEGEYDSRLTELKALYASADTLKNERNLLQAQLADLQANFTAVEQDRLDRGKLIEAQGTKLSKIEGEYDSRLTELKALYASADTLKNERNLLQAQLADLQANFTAVEQDRLDRGKLIGEQGERISELEKLVWLTEQNRDYWKNVRENPH